MARSPIFVEVNDANGNIVTGATVTVRNRATGLMATVYQAETGATTISNPITVDAFGRAVGWVDRGDYYALVAGTNIVPYTIPIDAAPAGDRAIDVTWGPVSWYPTTVTTAGLAATPTSPGDSDRFIYAPSSPSTFSPMEFRYRSASSSTYKWESMGGGGHSEHVGSATRSMTANVWTDFTAGWTGTNHTSYTVPFSGEYDVLMYFASMNSGGASHVFLGPSVNASLPAIYAVSTTGAANYYTDVFGMWRMTLTGNDIIRMYGNHSATGTVTRQDSTMQVTPVRVL